MLIVAVCVADIFSFPGKPASKCGEVLQTRVVWFNVIAHAGCLFTRKTRQNMDTD